jgi:hypothetical protein
MHKVSKFVIIGFVLAFIVILVIYLVKTNTYIPVIPSPQSSPTLQATAIQKTQSSPITEIANYPTPRQYPTPQVLANGGHGFTYPEAGYSVEFPPDAALSVSDSTLDFSETIITFSRNVDPDGAVLEIFTDLNKEKISLNRYADEELIKIFHGKLQTWVGKIQLNAATIAGHPALTFDSKLNRPAVFIESKDRFFELILVPNMMAGNTPTKESVDLFWQIVDTFKIL